MVFLYCKNETRTDKRMKWKQETHFIKMAKRDTYSANMIKMTTCNGDITTGAVNYCQLKQLLLKQD